MRHKVLKLILIDFCIAFIFIQTYAQKSGDPFFYKSFDGSTLKTEARDVFHWIYNDSNDVFPVVSVMDWVLSKQLFFKYYGYDATGSYVSYSNGKNYKWNGDTLIEIEKIPNILNNNFEKAKIDTYEKKNRQEMGYY